MLVVADNQLDRDGLATLIADQPECSVAGQLAGPEYATTALGIYSPDVVARDLRMAFDPLPRVAR